MGSGQRVALRPLDRELGVRALLRRQRREVIVAAPAAVDRLRSGRLRLVDVAEKAFDRVTLAVRLIRQEVERRVLDAATVETRRLCFGGGRYLEGRPLCSPRGRALTLGESLEVITDAGAYELRSYENLAARLTLHAVYAGATHSFTVTGTIADDPRARSGATVYVYVARSREPSAYRNLAVVQTRRGGRFTFRTRIFPAPVSVFVYADSLHRRGCTGSSGGRCKAQTYDTITSNAFAVRQSR